MAKKTFKTYVAEWPNDNSANKIMGIDSDGEPVYIENNIPNNGTSTGLLDGGNLSINFGGIR